MEALHENELPFINGGEHVEWVPEIPIWLSLVIILGTLAVTTVASLLKVRRDPSAAKSAPADDTPAEPARDQPAEADGEERGAR
jgi:tellurite resistance protein TerC